MKPLNRGHLQVLKNLPVIERWPLLGGNFKKIVTFGTKRFVRYSWYVRYLGCPLLGGFTVITMLLLESNPLHVTGLFLYPLNGFLMFLGGYKKNEMG